MVAVMIFAFHLQFTLQAVFSPHRTELGHQFLPSAIPLAPLQPGLGSPRILLSGRVHISVSTASRSEGSFATFRASPSFTNGVPEPLPLPSSLFSWPWRPSASREQRQHL